MSRAVGIMVWGTFWLFMAVISLPFALLSWLLSAGNPKGHNHEL